MFRNYLLTAWRHLLGNPLFSFINIFGLAVALAACILILLFVRDELSHDRQLPDAERIVRLHSAYRPPDAPAFLTVRSAGRLMGALSSYAPDLIDTGVRLLRVDPTVRIGDRAFNETVVFADGTFFDVFDLPWLHGEPGSAFASPGDLVISEATAIKYFGRSDVVGEVLEFCCLGDAPLEIAVSGVIRDLPPTSHLEVELLIRLQESMFDFAPNVLATWTSVNTYTYFKLHPGVTAGQLKDRIWQWLDTESPFVEMVGEDVVPTERVQPNVMPVPDIYLHARRDAGNMGDMRPLGDIRMVYAFIGITLLVLALAAVNFMNLSTARASQRAREVALRKVLGATRHQVAVQFLGEAIAVTLIAMLLAMATVELLLPLYNSAIGRELDFSLASELPLAALLVAAAVLVGLVAGSYPAAYLSRFLPARILRASQPGDDAGPGRLRNLLVLFQFTVSIALGIATAVIYAQTQYVRTTDLGYDSSHRLVLRGIDSSGIADSREVLAERLRRIPGVRSVVLSSEVPSEDNENNTGFQLLEGPRQSAAGEEVILNYYGVGFDFFAAYDMQLVAGRGFSRGFGTDTVTPQPEDAAPAAATVVINESAARRLGFASPAEAIGNTLRADLFRAGNFDLRIVGVARDVYFRSLKFGIRPSVFINQPNAFRRATIAYAPSADTASLLRDVEAVWEELAPLTPVSHEFLDAMLAAQYAQETRQAQLFAAFATLAVVIACLGLYGLAAFSADRRTREVGIRKVLGARVRDIVTLLVWQFSRPVLLANLIAWPSAWLLLQGWLREFEYRLGTGAILAICVGASALSLLIAWATVAGRALRVARANPVNALHCE